MAKATGKDPTKNTYALLLDAHELEESPSKSKKAGEAPQDRPPGYIPTPAEKEQERKKKEEEQKKIVAEKEKKKKEKAETETTKSKTSEKMSREQWEQQNKQKKLQQASNPAQPGQSDDGWSRPKQQQQQQQGVQVQSGQDSNRGGRRGGRFGGRGGREGDGQNAGYQNQGQQGGRGGDGRRGGRGGRGGEGRRGGGRRGGPGRNFEGADAARLEENKNRDVNQRGQDLTGERPPRKRPFDRKSGRFVKDFSNNNVGDFPKVEQETQDWTTNAAPPPETEVAGPEGWGENDEAPTTDPTAEVDKATTEATPDTAAPDQEKPKENQLPTKGYDEFLAEREKKKSRISCSLRKNSKN